MTRADQTNYRAMAARCNYLALGRPDIGFVVKAGCRKMESPTALDWVTLARLA